MLSTKVVYDNGKMAKVEEYIDEAILFYEMADIAGRIKESLKVDYIESAKKAIKEAAGILASMIID